ncbi:lysine transporter, partial [Corynebacterium pseudotuberculosis]
QLGKINTSGAPWVAQLISTIVIQIWVIVFFINQTTYVSMVQLATVLYLVPYVFSAFYLILLATRGKGISHPAAGARFDDSGPEVSGKENRRHLAVALLAFVYSLWLFYAADLKYVLFGALAVLPGLIPYVGTRLYKKEQVFNAFEWIVVALIACAGCYGIYGISTGTMSL